MRSTVNEGRKCQQVFAVSHNNRQSASPAARNTKGELCAKAGYREINRRRCIVGLHFETGSRVRTKRVIRRKRVLVKRLSSRWSRKPSVRQFHEESVQPNWYSRFSQQGGIHLD